MHPQPLLIGSKPLSGNFKPFSDRFIHDKLSQLTILSTGKQNDPLSNDFHSRVNKNWFFQPGILSNYSLTDHFYKDKLKKNDKKSVPTQAFKTLKVPGLIDDFYFNLVDWSSENVIGIGVGAYIYILTGCFTKFSCIYKLQRPQHACSINFDHSGLIAIGDNQGVISIIDLQKQQKIIKYKNHYHRIGSINWHGKTMATGSRDGIICISDIRMGKRIVSYRCHSKQICSIKWDGSGAYIASGANDAKLAIFDVKKSNLLTKFHNHNAAIKGLEWCPFNSGLIASGGGTVDKKIKFFNIKLLSQVYSIDTGTQICNLTFSKISNQLITTHGYSQNQINLWETNDQWKSLKLQKTLKGHNHRVLYLANSPQGNLIATGSGDETLKIWDVFQNKSSNRSRLLDPCSLDLR